MAAQYTLAQVLAYIAAQIVENSTGQITATRLAAVLAYMADRIYNDSEVNVTATGIAATDLKSALEELLESLDDIIASIPEALTDLDTTVTGAQLNAIKSTVDGIEEGATADQTGDEIVSLLETLSGSDRLSGAKVDYDGTNSITGILGTLVTRLSLTWSSEINYGLGEFAFNDGALYNSIEASNTNHEPPNASYWNLVVTATQVRDLIETLTTTDRLNKSAILGADFALNYRATCDLNDSDILQSSVFINIQQGDFWICDTDSESATIPTKDWVIALQDDLEYPFDFADDSEWERLTFGTDLNTKADKTNVIQKNSTTAYTPTTDYHPANKKYVDDQVIEALAGDNATIVDLVTKNEREIIFYPDSVKEIKRIVGICTAGTRPHAQGAASDGEFIFASSDELIKKYTIEGVDTGISAVDAHLSGTNIRQVNGLFCKGDYLYVSSSNYENPVVDPKLSYIKRFLKSDLSYVDEIAIGTGGVLGNYAEQATYYNGFWWCCYFDSTKISKYTDAWVWVADYDLGGDDHSQGLLWFNGYMLRTITKVSSSENYTEVWSFDGTDFTKESVISPATVTANQGIGIIPGKNILLYGMCDYVNGNTNNVVFASFENPNRIEVTDLDNSFKERKALSSVDVDWSIGSIFTKTLTANSTLTFSGTGNSTNAIKTLLITGDYTLTLPSNVKIISGTYDGTVDNYIQIHCVYVDNSDFDNNEYWATINQEAV